MTSPQLVLRFASMRAVDLMAVAVRHACDPDSHTVERLSGMSREQLAAWTADRIAEGVHDG